MQDVNAREPQKRAKAATKDVLGSLSKPVRIKSEWKAYYEKLSELRDRFVDQREHLVKDAAEETPNFSEHMADAGTDSYDRDFTLSLLSSEQNALYEIDQAIKRIENGTYGLCELTGEKIQPERLEAIPWARFSADAERDLEDRGVVSRAKLGTLGSVTATEPSEKDVENEDES